MVRKATIEDIPRIAEIIVFGKRVAYRHIFNNDVFSFNELQVINLIEEYRNNLTLIENMLVYDDVIIKGVINRNYRDNDVEICEFYVEPFFKGNGIGKELIQQAILESKANKRNKIFLWVVEDNVAARKFYESNGFVKTGQSCIIEGTAKTDMCYELIL